MDNELITLEIIHRYVEVLDRYFGNVRHAWRLLSPDIFFLINLLGLRAGFVRFSSFVGCNYV
jgi:Clathrin adaptor complex small chain